MKLVDVVMTPKDAREILKSKENALIGRALKQAMDKYPDQFKTAALRVLGVIDELEFTPPRKEVVPTFKVRRKEFILTDLIPVLSLNASEFYLLCSRIQTDLTFNSTTYDSLRDALAIRAPYLSPSDRLRVINFMLAVLDLAKIYDKETGIYTIGKKKGSVSLNTLQDVLPYYNRLVAVIQKGMPC